MVVHMHRQKCAWYTSAELWGYKSGTKLSILTIHTRPVFYDTHGLMGNLRVQWPKVHSRGQVQTAR